MWVDFYCWFCRKGNSKRYRHYNDSGPEWCAHCGKDQQDED